MSIEKTQYIQVILPLKLEWQPYYICKETVEVGERIRVNFSGKEYVGVVYKTNVCPKTNPSKIKEVIGKEKELEKISLEEIRLWEGIANYYLCSLGDVYKIAYPAMKISQEEAEVKANLRAIELREKKQTKLEEKKGKILKRIEAKSIKLELIIEKAASGRNKTDKTQTISDLKDEISKLREDVAEIERTTNFKINIASSNGQNEEYFKLNDGQERESFTLSDDQERAFNEIKNAFELSKPALLDGVTGSGKTEIYIKLALEQLEKGKSVLYLIPEISISRQLEYRLEKIFGASLFSFHSSKTHREKRELTKKIRSGKPYIVLGTRSSLFLPHKDLGLIIVDEEHDTSYKQDSPAPRYNARETSIMLAHIHKSNLILGSATPSLESIYNCEVNKYKYIKLSEKYFKGASAPIEIIDTIAERKKNGMVGNFSRKLIQKIEKCLETNGQILLLRARRSFSPILQCTQCGEMEKCPHCNVSLSYHKEKNRMICHYCGFSLTFTGQCNKCSGVLKGLGSGTEQIEEELNALFPNARIARLDADTKKNKNFEIQTIRDFEEGKINILIGTQIIPKGFDFANLNLVAILSADSLLGAEDFRADEKAFQTLNQLRGRCNRRNNEGLFAIQTSQPNHPIYNKLREDKPFSETSIMEERKDFNYPPYTRICNIILKDRYENRLNKLAFDLNNYLCEVLKAKYPNSIEIIGPYPPPISKISDINISIIRFIQKKDKNTSIIKAELASRIKDFEKEKQYLGHIFLDVDPS